MDDITVIKHINAVALFYLDFFRDAKHMEHSDNGVYRVILPKEGEQGIRFVYDIRLETLNEHETAEKIAEIRALKLPTWWGLYPLHSETRRELIYGENFTSQPLLESGKYYMALLPGARSRIVDSEADIKQIHKASDFALWAEIANTVFAKGYQDIHPKNHFHCYEKGRLTPYIAYVQNSPAAICAIMNNNGIASLEFAATLPEFRRNGLARAVCTAAIDNTFADGAEIITLRAFHPANLLYESLGFQTFQCNI